MIVLFRRWLFNIGYWEKLSLSMRGAGGDTKYDNENCPVTLLIAKKIALFVFPRANLIGCFKL
jgi:hypothetical protein